ncbi:MAG: glycosyltransferase [Candidatus Omnitrophica bacterium]|nr:glycosyltransferase [Candidatus Omnitrophota bacterium]
MPDKKVSVIMVNYNYARFIEEAIESVLSQSYKNWELIIVDDGSTDNSVSKIRKYSAKYPEKIMVYEHQDRKNKNLSLTYQLGLKYAQGEYFAFLESDDLWRKDSLAERVKVFKEHKDIILVFSDIELFGEQGARMDQIKKTLYVRTAADIIKNEPFYTIDFIARNLIPTFSVVMVKRFPFMNLNFFPPDAYLAWLDWWLWGQCSVNGAFYYIPEKLAKWRIHIASNNSLNDRISQQIPGYQKEFCRILKQQMKESLKVQPQPGLALLLFDKIIYRDFSYRKDKDIQDLKNKLNEIEDSKCWKIVLFLRYCRQVFDLFLSFLKTLLKVGATKSKN